MQLFYFPDIEENEFLPEEEARHGVQVLRMKQNDIITCTDGKGHFFKAKIIDTNPKKCRIEIVEKSNALKHNYNLHIGIAPTKNIERFELFLEKATEIGIDEITPILCNHSERKIIKEDRLEKIIISALKQSLKAHLPKLNPMTDFKRFVSREKKEMSLFIAHCRGGMSKQLLGCNSDKNQNVEILIGPEGDFDEKEVLMAIQHGYNSMTLGNNRYRTETAGILATHTIHMINSK